MPLGSHKKSEDKLLRTLIFGRPKTRKTTWACLCAELGFNVLLLNGDEGDDVMDSQISPEAVSRILTVDLKMQADRTIFAPFIASFLKPKKSFLWDEKAKVHCLAFPNQDHSHIKFDASKLSSNDVVVLDGWKALAKSTLFKYAEDHRIDLSAAEREEWDGYNYCGNFLDFVLARMHALPCHLIVVAHSNIYEIWDRRTKPNKMISSRMQPISSSGRHAEKLAGEFGDVFYFERLSPTAVTINTGGDADRDGGSRLFEPRVYQFDDFLPDKLFEARGLKGDPTRKCEGAIWYAPGDEVPFGIAMREDSAEGGENKVIEPPAAGSLLARLQALKKGGATG